MEATFSGTPTGPVGRTVFDWVFGRRFLGERSTAPDPAPDSVAIIGPNDDDSGYLQHYFDSRGVVRLYVMTFIGGVWTLSRERADFSPLDFKQRFIATFSRDGRTIDGRWEIDEGAGWRVDFPLTYRKIA